MEGETPGVSSHFGGPATWTEPRLPNTTRDNFSEGYGDHRDRLLTRLKHVHPEGPRDDIAIELLRAELR